MRHDKRNRFAHLSATGFVLSLSASLLGLGASIGPAVAATELPTGQTPAPPVPYTASSSANILHVSAGDARPLGVNIGPLVDLKISTAGSSADSTRTPRTEAASSQLDLAVGQRLPNTPRATVSQTAPPDHTTPTVVNRQSLDLGVAKIGLGHLLAHARWNESCENPTDPTQLTNSSVSLANVALLPGSKLAGLRLPVQTPSLGQATSVVELPSTAYAQSRSDIVDVDGQDGLGVQAQARVSLAQLILFRGTSHQVIIKVISPPTLTVVAAGTERSSVDYKAPILEITTADGKSQRLESPHAVVEIPLVGTPATTNGTTQHSAPTPPPAQTDKSPAPNDEETAPHAPLPGLPGLLGNVLGLGGNNRSANSQGNGQGGGVKAALNNTRQRQPALLRLSIADLTKTVTNTSVTAQAASIRLEVLDVPGSGKLLDVALGQLTAKATVPPGGIDNDTPISPSVKPAADDNRGENADTSGNLPITGASTGLVIAAGVLLVIVGRLVMLLARRRAAAG